MAGGEATLGFGRYRWQSPWRAEHQRLL